MNVLIQERLSSEAEPRGILQTTLRAKIYDIDYIANVSGFTSKLVSMLTGKSFSNYTSNMSSLASAAIKTNKKGSLQRFLINYGKMEL